MFSTLLTSNQTHLYLLQMLSNILEELLEGLGIGEYGVVDVVLPDQREFALSMNGSRLLL